MLDDTDRDVRLAATEAVGLGGIAQAAPTVTRWALSEDTDPDLRFAAIAALEGIAGTDCAEALFALVSSPNAEVAERACSEPAADAARVRTRTGTNGRAYGRETSTDAEDWANLSEDPTFAGKAQALPWRHHQQIQTATFSESPCLLPLAARSERPALPSRPSGSAAWVCPSSMAKRTTPRARRSSTTPSTRG
jgi:hypothetical protein